MILAGDVGSRKVQLALYCFSAGELKLVRDAAYAARDYAGLEEIVREFLVTDKPTAACFGVPGPVRDGRLRLTDLPWTLDQRELARKLGIDYLFLINDLEANCHGIAELGQDQVHTLSRGDSSQTGNRALIAAGRGLGEGFIVWDGRHHKPYPSEGGHADFSPRNEDEIDLLRFLRHKYNGRVSYERVVSGQGFINIYEFLRDVRGLEEPAWLAARMHEEDPNAVITELAMAAKSEICEKTTDLLVSAFGAEAGNFALKVLAVGGVYLGGGIAPRILEKLKDGTFMKAFTDKGRLSQLLVNTPVRVILERRTALMGAAAYAEARAAEVSGISPRAASVKF